MDLSILIPLYNEAESIPELIEWIYRVMDEHKYDFEIILVDDGSKDNSWDVILSYSCNDERIRGIQFRRNYGKSAALHVGFHHARGKIVVTMDADLQDSPDEIPSMIKMITDKGFDLVSGWKKVRYDPISKTIPTKIFNWATRLISGIKLHDFNCGLKAYRADVVKSIELHGEMHRYIPVIAHSVGFDKIGEKVVQHRPRKYGKTKYGGISRFINGFLDLLTISFISRFGKRPMHIFGLFGTALFFVGFLIALYFVYLKVFLYQGKMTERPLFYLGLLCMIIGSQLFIGGFLAELIIRNSSERNIYSIKSKTFSD